MASENGCFCTWPGLTAKLVTTYMEKLMSTASRHYVTSSKHLRSAKDKPSAKYKDKEKKE